LGTSQGGVIVRVIGSDPAGIQKEQALCVYAAEKGERIPAILASLATQKILSGKLHSSGIVPHPDWILMKPLTQELGRRNIKTAFRESTSTDWEPFRLDEPSVSATMPAA
jgi:hypothetical protein